jgi:amino acid transporter
MSAHEPQPASAVGEAALRRDIGLLLAVLLVVNATIGTGIFKKPASVVRLTGTLDAAFGVWIAGGVIALCGALSLAELAAMMPRAGGLYEYLRRTYGPTAAFMLGWTKLTLLVPSAVGSFGRLAGEALTSTLGLAPDRSRETVFAVFFVLVCVAVNLLGVKTSAIQQAVITAAKYLGVVALAVIGIFVATRVDASTALPPPEPGFATRATLTGCFGALVSVMWAYDGWADLASLSGEVRAPERNLPRALVVGTVAIVAVYLAANIGYARALGVEGLRRSSTGGNIAAANVAILTLGPIGRRLLSAVILVSCLGGCMSSLLTGSRIFVPLASDGLFVAALGYVSPQRGVPTRAVAISGALGAMYVSARSFEQLTDAFVVGFFPFYILAVCALFVLRRREPDAPRPFRVPLYPFVPIVFLVGAIAPIAGAIHDVNETAFVAFGVMALGFPVRWTWARINRSAGEPVRAP